VSLKKETLAKLRTILEEDWDIKPSDQELHEIAFNLTGLCDSLMKFRYGDEDAGQNQCQKEYEQQETISDPGQQWRPQILRHDPLLHREPFHGLRAEPVSGHEKTGERNGHLLGIAPDHRPENGRSPEYGPQIPPETDRERLDKISRTEAGGIDRTDDQRI